MYRSHKKGTNMEIQMEINAAESVSPANVFAGVDEATLENRLAALEARLAELESSMTQNVTASAANMRKTLPAGMAVLLNKQGVAVDALEAGSLDVALSSLSIEQRIAVKSQLLRSGLMS
jgi:hypothetical protein